MDYNGPERVFIRALEPEDAYAVWEMETDSSQWLFNGMMAPFSLRNIKEYALNYDPDPFRAGQIRFIAQKKARTGNWSDDVVGLVDLYDISAHDRTAWVGIYVRPCFRMQGYASEMLDAMERYARDILNLRTVAAKVVDGNQSSRKLFETARFDFRGVLKNWIEIGVRRMDLLFYQKNL